MKVFHGTSTLYKDQILRMGLCAGSSSDGVVNVTTSRAYAEEQAQFIADCEEREPLLFSIEVNESELTPNRRGGEYSTYCFEMASISPERLAEERMIGDE